MLLARSPHFAPGVYSTLAGFVEPGESLEEAVVREIREEVGVELAGPPLLLQPALAVPQLADDRLPGALGRRRDPAPGGGDRGRPLVHARTTCPCCRPRRASRGG